MKLLNFDLHPAETRRLRKRVGRGHGSGNGKTSGKGHKGQKARSGGSIRRGFEGGQMPLQRRIPKRGFNNAFALRVESVNIKKLEIFEENSVVDSKVLKKSGIVKRKFDKLKIIGDHKLSKKITVKVDAFSKSARLCVESAGGIAEVVGGC
ncbi:MAG: 50S ribosomal protein L15 [Oscillospiraceae bacterium]|jgi:large subunit ribosomal protein L15|nr:50S ribosomal protein L15 [Oscillospiraceae bacterium]